MFLLLNRAKNINALVYALLVCIGVSLYYTSLSGGYIFDDYPVIIADPALRVKDVSGLIDSILGHERPVRFISYYIDSRIWGLNPFGFRLTNLLLHILNASLLYYLLKKILKDTVLSFSGAIFFLLHPVLPSAVCYITARKDLLGVFFALNAIILYWIFREKEKTVLVCVSFLMWVLAFFSKESYIVLPFFYILIDRLFFQKRISLSYFLWLIPAIFFIFSAAHYKKINFNAPIRLVMIPEYLTSYLTLFFNPIYSKLDYVNVFKAPVQYRDIKWGAVAVYSLPFIAYVLTLVILYIKHQRELFFFVIGFLVALLPVLQIVAHSEAFADHYLYFPALFLSSAIPLFFTQFIKNRNVIISVCATIICFLFFTTHARTKFYMNEASFWHAVNTKNPNNFRAIIEIGKEDVRRNEYAKALDHFKRGLILTKDSYHDDPVAFTYYYDYLQNISSLYIMQGEYDKARDIILKDGINVPESKRREVLTMHLAYIYLLTETDGVKKVLDILKQYPDYSMIKYLLYDYYWFYGRVFEANTWVMDILRQHPDDKFSLIKTCLYNLKKGNRDIAMQYFSKVRTFSPANYYELNDMAEIEMDIGSEERAYQYLNMALHDNPSYGRTLKNLRKIVDRGYKP